MTKIDLAGLREKAEALVRALAWTEYPNSFYPDVFVHCWDAQTPFGSYTIEEGSAGDSPCYEVNYGQSIIAIKDGLPEAKEAAQIDFAQRALSTVPALLDRVAELEKALRPFAALGDARAKLALGPDTDYWPITDCELTLGDIRLARLILGATP